jgi:hypothetical protein
MKWMLDGTISAILSHIARVLVHKYYLIISGIKLRVPIYCILSHDLSKFGFSELIPYARQFFMDEKLPDQFGLAWLHHQNCNKHHWEYYIIRSSKGSRTPKPLCMPRKFAREMVADWMAASKSYVGSWDMNHWLDKHWNRMVFHPDTRRYVSKLLQDLGYDMSKFN